MAPSVAAAASTHRDVASTSTLELHDVAKTDFVLRTFRCLIADLCEQFKGGHPGYV
jgi:dihydroxyacetone synthase